MAKDLMLVYSIAALIIGFGLDLLFGDPRGFPHIVVGMEKLISGLEKVLRKCLPCIGTCFLLYGGFLPRQA